MRAPLSWIKEFVDIPSSVTSQDIAEALIRVGFEVEEVIEQGKDLTGPLVFGLLVASRQLSRARYPRQRGASP